MGRLEQLNFALKECFKGREKVGGVDWFSLKGSPHKTIDLV
jgi:hypothetical protein